MTFAEQPLAQADTPCFAEILIVQFSYDAQRSIRFFVQPDYDLLELDTHESRPLATIDVRVRLSQGRAS